jgi:DNA repair protein RadD
VIEQWRRGEFDVLVNASIFTTGFDEPSIGCVILARATMSENLYLQMIGRGSRIFKDKTDFTLLDFGENVQRHGEYNQARIYSLVHSVRLTKGAPVIKECPQCNSYLIGSSRTCNFCGYNFPLSKKEIVEVELAPYISLNIGNIDVTNPDQLDRILRAKKKTPSWAARQIFVTNRENARNLIKNFANFKGYKNYWVELTYKTLGI